MIILKGCVRPNDKRRHFGDTEERSFCRLRRGIRSSCRDNFPVCCPFECTVDFPRCFSRWIYRL
eukprot:07691.XXX_394753_394944_1 [CDS] Oithona nana genome sequencing.